MFKLKGFYSTFVLMTIFVFCMGWVGDACAAGWWGYGQGQQDKGHGKGHAAAKANKNASKLAKKTSKSKKVKFVHKDKVIIKKYFSATPFPVTPLPPGIAKNLRRGKPLPPGIAKVFLPSDLVSQLPVYPGYEYLAVGRDAVLIDSTTGIISDVLFNVLR